MGEISQSEANLVLGKLFVLWDFQGQPRRQRIIPAAIALCGSNTSLFSFALLSPLCPSGTAFEIKISVLSSKCAILHTCNTEINMSPRSWIKTSCSVVLTPIQCVTADKQHIAGSVSIVLVDIIHFQPSSLVS